CGFSSSNYQVFNFKFCWHPCFSLSFIKVATIAT
ncbi:MAG: hypothetical protein ACI81A_001310, partial [Paraglaciecola sp.]